MFFIKPKAGSIPKTNDKNRERARLKPETPIPI